MFKTNLKKNIISLGLILVIFSVDRISKIYILKFAKLENAVDIYLTSYLNLNLVWNQGIAFGLFSMQKSYLYGLISFLIVLVILAVIVMLIKTDSFKKYLLAMIIGGALGNLFDRMYYSGVPDFIDLHVNEFHWFIFNIADIFITLGVITMILLEIFNADKSKL